MQLAELLSQPNYKSVRIIKTQLSRKGEVIILLAGNADLSSPPLSHMPYRTLILSSLNAELSEEQIAVVTRLVRQTTTNPL